MKIYIEQILITNFIIDFCILLMVNKIIYSKLNFKYLILSSLFGSVASLIYPFCSNPILINALKIITAIIMLQILHIPQRQLIKATFTMLCLSYILGGALLSTFGKMVNGGYALTNVNIIYVVIIALIFSFIIHKLVEWLKQKIITNSNILDTTLILNNTKLTIKSFIDSGNTLYDNNTPVSLVNFETFYRLTNISLEDYINNNFSSLINPHFISAKTVAGTKKILVFTINELHITNKIYKNVSIGVAINFDNNKEYKAILNSSFCLN